MGLEAAEHNVPHGSKNQDPNASKKFISGYRKGYGTDFKGKRLSMLSSDFSRDGLRKSGKERTWALGYQNCLPRPHFSEAVEELPIHAN